MTPRPLRRHAPALAGWPSAGLLPAGLLPAGLLLAGALLAAPARALPGDGAARDTAAPPSMPLSSEPGDAARGRAIVADRRVGLCLLCHAAPIPEQRFQGDLAPDLAGAGRRWTAQQLRLRIADPARFNPDTIMPAYYRTEGLERVPAALRGRTILSGRQIEDVVAYLLTLGGPAGEPAP